MDHILQLEHPYSSLKHCNPGVARFRKRVNASQVVSAFAAAVFLALLLSVSMGTSLCSILSDGLLAVGSFVMSKKALFFLSNVIFLFLAADYCCTSATDVATCEPGDSSLAYENYTYPEKVNGVESKSTPGMSDNTTPLEEQEEQEDVPVTSKLELFRPDDEPDSITLETVVVEEPTCETAQELEKLEINELNKKFEEFIQSRRFKWMEEAAAVHLQWQKETMKWQKV